MPRFMPRFYKTALAGICATTIVSGFLPAVFLTPVASAAAIWQKGATIDPLWNGEFASGDFQQSLKNLVAMHANYITLAVPLYQSNTGSTDIQTGGNTPTV